MKTNQKSQKKMNKISGIMCVAFIVGMLVFFNYANGQSQGEVNPIPYWIKIIFSMYAQELISDKELINALQYLIQVGIIEL